MQMVRTEQKSVLLMNAIGHKYCRCGDVVSDLLAGTLSTSKGWLLLEKHRRLVGYEWDISCLQKPMTNLLIVYDSQLLKDQSDWTGSYELKTSVLV